MPNYRQGNCTVRNLRLGPFGGWLWERWYWRGGGKRLINKKPIDLWKIKSATRSFCFFPFLPFVPFRKFPFFLLQKKEKSAENLFPKHKFELVLTDIFRSSNFQQNIFFLFCCYSQNRGRLTGLIYKSTNNILGYHWRRWPTKSRCVTIQRWTSDSLEEPIRQSPLLFFAEGSSGFGPINLYPTFDSGL